MNLEKAVSMINGVSSIQFEASLVSEADKTQIRAALDSLFSGHSLSEWIKGGHLGKAQESAAAKIRRIIAEITQSNSAVMFLRNMAWPALRIKINSLAANETAREYCMASESQKRGFAEYAAGEINHGMAVLKEIMEKYETSAPRADRPAQKLNDKVINKIMSEKIMSRVRENERELERERTF